VEEQFYFVWPWIVFSLRSRRKLIWVCALAAVIVPVLRLLCQESAPDWMIRNELLNRATPFQIDSLLLGGLIALLLRGPHRQILFRVGKIAFACLSLFVLPYLLWAVVKTAPNWFSYALPAWKLTWGLTIINLFAAGLLLLCVDPSTMLYRLLCFGPLRWLGRISYGAYIFHDIFKESYYAVITSIGAKVGFVARHDIFFTTLFALVCTILLSWLSFEYFESVFLNLKERWTIRQVSPSLQPASTR
jgi:peptidoglycan/LPS O-acetylase OafA/YrhL